jgi:hypothetical protein
MKKILFLTISLLLLLSFKPVHVRAAEEYYCPYDNQIINDNGYCVCHSGYTMSSNGECHISSAVPSVPNYPSFSGASRCITPLALGCTTQNEVGVMTIQQNLYGISNPAAIQACQDQVNQYKADTDKFNQCLATISSTSNTPAVTSPSNSCISQFGSHSIVSPDKVGYCSCATGYIFDSNDQCVLKVPTCPADTSFLGYDNTCVCRYGANIDGQCKTQLEKCISDIGKHNNCRIVSGVVVSGCENGYKNAFGKCVIDPSYSPSPPSQSDVKTGSVIISVPKTTKKIGASKPVATPPTKDTKIELNDWNNFKNGTGKYASKPSKTPNAAPKLSSLLNKVTVKPKESFIKRIWSWFAKLF